MKKITIFIITRKRVNLLKNLINSLIIKCYNKKNIEIIFGLDFNDEETNLYLKDNPLLNSIDYKIHYSTPRAWCKKHQCYHHNRFKDFLNPMCLIASGDLFWILNDDTTIATDDYDQIIIDTVESFLSTKSDSRILLAGCREIRSQRAGSKTDEMYFYYYPIITRETYNTLGYFLPETSSSDVRIWEIFKASNAWDRIIDIPVIINDIVFSDHIGFAQHDNDNYGSNINYLINDVIKINNVVTTIAEPKVFRKIVFGLQCSKCNHENIIKGHLLMTLTNIITCSNCHCCLPIPIRLYSMLYQNKDKVYV